MSALTRATVIVEAGNTSGTRTQARAALQQGDGRKLFILDSCFRIQSSPGPGSSKLKARFAFRILRRSPMPSAMLLTKADDLLREDHSYLS